MDWTPEQTKEMLLYMSQELCKTITYKTILATKDIKDFEINFDII